MEASQLVLPTILFNAALALVMSSIATLFQIRRDRLPDATRLENVRELRAQEERNLAERRAELSVVEQKIQQRDRLVAEVAGLEERRTSIQAELASLDAARREIEEVKADAASAAAELATVLQELAEKREELDHVTAQCDPTHVSALTQEIHQLREEKTNLASILPELRTERDVALQRIEQARTLEAQVAARSLERDRLTAEIEQLLSTKADFRDVEVRLVVLRQEARTLDNQKNHADAVCRELDTAIQRLKDEQHQLSCELEPLRDHVGNLKNELAQKRSTHNDLAEEVDRLAARKERLQAELEGPEPDTPADPRLLLDDLLKVPACLAIPAIHRLAPRTENDALASVSQYLGQCGLSYSTRTIRAFHTSLKINDSSQLTVLAGVSGTGKSLLPRRYAEAIGMHFLQLAVEPRWDSPQDLLGFYNYIEKNYRATDLARILLHMDPYEDITPDADHPYGDHMALVLLDEMNLARVEYYFSEFLSRLEARPRFAETDDEHKRADARIPIDIRGLSPPISLYPSHNVLFAGTMNDDESTQSLSDKVLDRANILQFAAPRHFPALSGTAQVQRPNEAQSFTAWRRWIQPNDSLEGNKRAEVDRIISKLAELMESCGRPFGHRLRDAIYAYVVNYPIRDDVRIPLADQIEFRILPKLRGIDLQSQIHRNAVNRIATILNQELSDASFGARLEDLCDQQSAGAGLFVWRGLSR